MELEINKADLQEIEARMEDLTGWLVNHFCSVSAVLFVMQSIQEAVNDFKKKFDEE